MADNVKTKAEDLKADVATQEVSTDAPKVKSPAKRCPNHLKNDETVKLQGDPTVRCAWCHTPLA